MKITHRVVAVATIVGVAGLALSACSSGGSTPSTGSISGTVTGVFDKQYESALAPIVKDFEKKYPKVKVDINYQGGSNLGPAILTEIQAGTAPDVLLTFPGGDAGSPSDNVTPLAAEGRILPITADWSSQVPAAWKPSVEYKGKLYAFPGALQPLAAIYNQTLMNSLGLKVPTTLKQVYQLCSDAKSKGVYAYAQGLGDTSAGPQMLSFAQTASLIYGKNPTWDNGLATGKSTYTNSGWQTQFGIYEKMYKDDCFGAGSLGRTREQGQEAVAQRQALGLVDVGAVLAGIQATDKTDRFIVTAIPANNSGTNSITALPGYTLTVNAKAKNPAAAKAFVEFAGEPAESAKFATGFGSVPLVPNKSFVPPANLKAFNALVIAGKTAPLANLQPEVQTTLNTAVQSMLLGKYTPATAAQALQTAYSK